MTKFCKNCKHYRTPLLSHMILDECISPKITRETSMITGKTYPYEKSCWYLRKVYGECGVDGKFFEPIPTTRFYWLQRIFLLCR